MQLPRANNKAKAAAHPVDADAPIAASDMLTLFLLMTQTRRTTEAFWWGPPTGSLTRIVTHPEPGRGTAARNCREGSAGVRESDP